MGDPIDPDLLIADPMKDETSGRVGARPTVPPADLLTREREISVAVTTYGTFRDSRRDATCGNL